MSAFLAVAGRELRESKAVVLGALLLAAGTFLALRPDRIIAVAVAAAAIATLLLAATLGISADEKRLSFYLSRPIGAAAIWLGKLAASLLLIYGAAFVIIAPAMLVFPRAWASTWSPSFAPLLFVPLLLFLLMHFLSTAARSRSPLLLLDFLLGGVLYGALLLIVAPLVEASAFRLAASIAITLLALFTVAAIAGGVWQIERGRADVRAGHRALSRFLWSCFFAFAALTAAYVGWVVSATPRDLTSVRGDRAPGGPWIVIEGRSRLRGDYVPTFALNVRSGAWRRVPRGAWFATPDTIAYGQELTLQRLGERPVETGIARSDHAIVVSGKLVAAAGAGMLTVDDLAARRRLLSARISETETSRYQLFFDSPSTLRVIQLPERPQGTKIARIFEADLRAHTLQQSGAATVGGDTFFFSGNSDGSRLFVRTDQNGAPALLDGRRGDIVAQFPFPSKAVQSGRILSDGRVAITTVWQGRATLHIGGTAVDLGQTERAAIFDELAGGILLVVKTASLDAIDLASGRILRTEERLNPVWQAWETRLSDPRRHALAADAIILATDANGQLVAWDPWRTGLRPVVIGRPRPIAE